MPESLNAYREQAETRAKEQAAFELRFDEATLAIEEHTIEMLEVPVAAKPGEYGKSLAAFHSEAFNKLDALGVEIDANETNFGRYCDWLSEAEELLRGANPGEILLFQQGYHAKDQRLVVTGRGRKINEVVELNDSPAKTSDETGRVRTLRRHANFKMAGGSREIASEVMRVVVDESENKVSVRVGRMDYFRRQTIPFIETLPSAAWPDFVSSEMLVPELETRRTPGNIVPTRFLLRELIRENNLAGVGYDLASLIPRSLLEDLGATVLTDVAEGKVIDEQTGEKMLSDKYKLPEAIYILDAAAILSIDKNNDSATSLALASLNFLAKKAHKRREQASE